MKKIHTAITLEGGGAKCAYQVGALVALNELGYVFDAFSGASFGAFNAAMYIEGGLDKLLSFYTNFEAEDIFLNTEIAEAINNFDKGNITLSEELKMYLKNEKTNFISTHQILSDNYHKLIEDNVDEETIRNSQIELYFPVTELPPTGELIIRFSTSIFNQKDNDYVFDKLRMRKHFFSTYTCPRFKMSKYIAAGANFPIFKPVKINETNYIDGGIVDNVPYRILLDNGYKKVIIIRTNIDNSLDILKNNKDIIILTPTQKLGNVANFTKHNFLSLIKQGYNETKNYFKINKLT